MGLIDDIITWKHEEIGSEEINITYNIVSPNEGENYYIYVNSESNTVDPLSPYDGNVAPYIQISSNISNLDRSKLVIEKKCYIRTYYIKTQLKNGIETDITETYYKDSTQKSELLTSDKISSITSNGTEITITLLE